MLLSPHYMPYSLKKEKCDVVLLLITHLDLITEVLNRRQVNWGDAARKYSSIHNPQSERKTLLLEKHKN